MVKRHFDIGLDDGLVTPWLAPGPSGCGAPQPEDYPTPGLASLKRHGFAIRFEIEPREWERARILSILHPRGPKGRIEPVRHFGPIMDFIGAQAIARYGPDVGDPGVQVANRGFESPRTRPSPPSATLDLAALAARWLTGENS